MSTNTLKTNNMNKEIEKRKDELLVELKKNVPQIEWEFQRVVEEIRHYKNERTLKGYDIFFEGIHNESKDECFIKFDNGREDVLELGYLHIPTESLGYQCKNTNHKHIDDWDGVNEFFNKYCIGYEGREEKIKSGDMVTPNMYDIQSIGTYTTSKNEYSEGVLNLLFEISKMDTNLNNSKKGHIKSCFNEFEEKYKKFSEHSINGYFGTSSEMIKYFISDILYGELECWLDKIWKEVVEEEGRELESLDH